MPHRAPRRQSHLPCRPPRRLLALAAAATLLTGAAPALAVDFIFSAGNYLPGTTAPEPLLAGDVLQINGGGNKFFNGVTLTNQSGLVNWNADSLFMTSGAVVNNAGLWDAKSDNALVYGGGALPTFNNTGTFRKSAGAGVTTIGGTIAFVNSGIIDAQSGAIDFSGGGATFNSGTQFTGAGVNRVSGNATFNDDFSSANLVLAGAASPAATRCSTAAWTGPAARSTAPGKLPPGRRSTARRASANS